METNNQNGNDQQGGINIDNLTIDSQFTNPNEGLETNTNLNQGENSNNTETTPPTESSNQLDAFGNLVNSEGQIIATAEQLANLKKEKEGEQGNGEGNDDNSTNEDNQETGTYSLDADGNLLKDGQVFREKGTFEVDEDGQVTLHEESTVDILRQKYEEKGYTFKDNEGNDITFEDSDEGLLKLSETVAAQKYNKQLNDFLQTYPIVNQMVNHLNNGNTVESFLENYQQPKDYLNLEVAADNQEGRKEIIKDYLTKVARNTPELTAKMLQMFEDAGEIDSQFEGALNGLRTWQQEETARQALEQEQRIAQAQAEVKAHWEGINKVIQTGKLGDFSLPEQDQGKLYDFVAKAVDESGNSARDKKYQELPTEKKLMIDYLLMIDFDMDKFVKARAQKEKVDALRKRKNKKPITIDKNLTYNKVGGSNSNISLNNIT